MSIIIVKLELKLKEGYLKIKVGYLKIKED